MTAREWYSSRIDIWTARRDALAARATVISRFRLMTFFGAVALIWWGLTEGSLVAIILGVALMLAFGFLVASHAKVLGAIDVAEAGLRLARRGVGRINRDWTILQDMAPVAPADIDEHPYARDLDLFGHASLANLLGPSATPTGQSTLSDWLLSGISADAVVASQVAIDDLARRPEWREAFASEGVLGQASTIELERFLSWVEGSEPAIPRSAQLAAIGVTLAIWLLIALQMTNVVDRAWWLIPMLVGIVLSFAYARRTYAVFDRASMGQRALVRYSIMLGLAFNEEWSSPELIRQQEELRDGGDAPRLIRRLSRLTEWSELRTAAALLHFPIQSLTLWDFHVLRAIEQWRIAHGRGVRRWLGALARFDALSVLAGIRHDCPEWAYPEVSTSCASLEATALGHPLIPDDRRVANDIEVGPAGTVLLITGSNMSGKSTLLRAIGLNAVLAQAGAPVCATRFRMPPSELRSSIRIQDSLELGLSYFMAALARLKAIVDAAERHRHDDRRLLYLLDEVLQGTNSAERAIAVCAIARHLIDASAVGVMTTHDLSLAGEEPFASRARLQHFAEQVHADGRMTFDYRLRSGLATSRNALRLMQLIGIPPQ